MRPYVWTMSRAVVWVLLISFALMFVIPRLDILQVSSRLETLAVRWLLAAGILTLIYYLFMFGLWFPLLRLFGSTPAPLLTFRAFVLPLLPNYVPGKVIALGTRAQLLRQAGVPISAAAASIIWDMMLTLVSVAAVSWLGLVYHPIMPFQRGAEWLLLGSALVVVFFAGARLLPSQWRGWTGVPEVVRQPRAVLTLLGLYTCAWLITGASHWCLAYALIPIPARAIFLLISATALSWGIGVLTVVAPAGLGVREGVLYLFVRNMMGEANALLFVTLSRLVGLGIELLLTVTWWMCALAIRRR